jgi:hypothetical protein
VSVLSRLLGRASDDSESEKSLERVLREFPEVLQQIGALNERVSRVTLREAQLRAMLERDAELETYQARLTDVIGNEGVGRHVERAIRKSELQLDPFPYAVVDNVLPSDLYSCLLRGIPPVELFADRPVNKQQLTVPFALAPSYSQRVWRYLATEVVPNFLAPAVLAQFRAPVDTWIIDNWPDVPPASVQFHTSDGRILRRGRGYRIPPHRDPKWGFLTCILYLARRIGSTRRDASRPPMWRFARTACWCS